MYNAHCIFKQLHFSSVSAAKYKKPVGVINQRRIQLQDEAIHVEKDGQKVKKRTGAGVRSRKGCVVTGEGIGSGD